MKVVATLMVGVLLGCLVIVGLGLFKNAVTAQAEKWVAHPPPEFTLLQRALLRAGNFVTSYLVFGSLFILPLAVGTAGFVGYRGARATRRPAETGPATFAESARQRFTTEVSTVFLESAVISLPVGLLLVWLGGGSLRSPLGLPGMDLATFVFPLFSFLGTVMAFILALWKRRWQFVVECMLGIALLALDWFLPQVVWAG